MAATPYRAVNWAPDELVGDAKMDQLSNNVQYVYENTPRVKYTTNEGLRRFDNVKIASGRVVIPAKPKSISASVTVSFGNFFSPGCEPNISTGVNHPVANNLWCTFRGFEGTGMLPDHTGFQLNVEIAQAGTEKNTLNRSFLVHWVAMGY